MTGTDIPEPLQRYYAAIDAADMEAAAACFAADTTYMKPGPALESGTIKPVTIHGRAALLRSLQERGPQPFRHDIRAWIGDDRGFIDAWVIGMPTRPSDRRFVAAASLDATGLIDSYKIVITGAEREHVESGPPMDTETFTAYLAGLVPHTHIAAAYVRTAPGLLGVQVDLADRSGSPVAMVLATAERNDNQEVVAWSRGTMAF